MGHNDVLFLEDILSKCYFCLPKTGIGVQLWTAYYQKVSFTKSDVNEPLASRSVLPLFGHVSWGMG